MWAERASAIVNKTRRDKVADVIFVADVIVGKKACDRSMRGTMEYHVWTV